MADWSGGGLSPCRRGIDSPFKAVVSELAFNPVLLIQGYEPEEHAGAVYTHQDLEHNWEVIYLEETFQIDLLFDVTNSVRYAAICIGSLTTALQ